MFHRINTFSRWLIPPICVFCQRLADTSLDLCSACKNDLPILTNYCQYCANILPTSPFQQEFLACGQCLKRKPPFDCTHALFRYQPPVTQFLWQLKFHHALLNAKLLGKLLTEHIQQRWYQNKSLPSAIIPIPLHTARLKQRGFNQSIEIAKPVAKAFRLPLLLTTVKRVKHTLPQASLPANARKGNIKQAFVFNGNISYKHVAVLDDVMTTGNTMVEFCTLLKSHGIEQIDVWCCARADITTY